MIIRRPQSVVFLLCAAFVFLAGASQAAAQTTCVDTLAVRVKSGKIQLEWPLVPGASSITVLRSTSAAGPFQAKATLGANAVVYLDSSATAGTTFYYQVRRNFAAGPCLTQIVGARLPAGRTAMTTVPQTVGDSQGTATQELSAASLTAAINTVNSASVPVGRVISQDPPAGSVVPQGTTVSLTVSLGPGLVALPNVVGATQASATTTLQGLGLGVTIATANHPTVQAGRVISQNPTPGNVAAGTNVTLTVSLGPALVALPNVVGATQASATTTLQNLGFGVTIATANHPTVLAGRVISQNPTAGNVAAGTNVTLTVSLGPALVALPNVVGATQASATTTLQNLGFGVTIATANHPTVLAGRVISQNPTAGNVAAGTNVTLTVSLGPALVALPNVVGATQASATTTLQNLGFGVTIATANHPTVPNGTVISQNPTAGNVAAGTNVTLTVSLGPALVALPNVVGATQASATTTLQNLGFGVTIATANSATVPSGTVISQNPTAGNVAAGTNVTLTVSLGPALVALPNVVGATQASATTTLQNLGFGVTIATANHPSVQVGRVISQNPTAGNVAPGTNVTLTISLGPGSTTAASIDVQMAQVLITAGGNSTFSATAFDGVGGEITPAPSISFQILPEPNGVSGTLPAINGLQITTSADTRGAYRLRGTVDGSAVTDDVLFSVVQAGAGQTNAAKFVTFAKAQGTAQTKLDELVDAFGSGNTAAIAGINQALQAARTSVVVTGKNRIQLSTAVAPEQGFLPSTAILNANGFTETAQDIQFGALLVQISNKLAEVTTFYNTLNPASATDDVAKLNTLNTQLAALEAQLAALTVSPHGIVKYASRINTLMANGMPAHLHALVSRIGNVITANGLASVMATPKDYLASVASPRVGPVSPQDFYRAQQPAFFGLAGLFAGSSLQMNLVNRIYGPIMAQVSRMMVLLAANSLLQSFINGGSLEGIITGGSLSFHAYDMPGSVIEGYGFNPVAARNDVFLVGTAAISAVEDLFNAFNPSNVDSLQDLVDFFDGIVNAIEGAGQAYASANQLPANVLTGCILDGGASNACSELEYPSGFSSVSSCNGFFCFVEPVIIIHRNLDTGSFSFGIFNFAP